MLAAALVLAVNGAALSQAAPSPTTHKAPVISTPAPLYNAPADDNGRLWISRPIIGGLDTSRYERGERDARAWDAASYGAFGLQNHEATVAVDGLFDFEAGRIVNVNPWSSLRAPDKDRKNPYGNDYKNARNQLRKQVEDARVEWLQEHNYTGGVRTFVNDEQIWHPEKRMTGMPEPRAIFEYPADQPRFKSRMQVRAPQTAPQPAQASPIKVVDASRDAAVHTNATIVAGPGRGRMGVPGKTAATGGAWTPSRVTKVVPATAATKPESASTSNAISSR